MNEINKHTNKGDRRCEITRGQGKEREREWERRIERKHNTSKTPRHLLGHLRRKQNCYLPPLYLTLFYSLQSTWSLFFSSNVSIRTWLSSCCLESFGVESLKEICHPAQPFNFKQETEKGDRKGREWREMRWSVIGRWHGRKMTVWEGGRLRRWKKERDGKRRQREINGMRKDFRWELRRGEENLEEKWLTAATRKTSETII